MLYIVVALLLIAAGFGVYMLSMVSGNKPRPNWVLLIHGGLAGTGISILLYYSAMHAEESAPTASILFFILAIFAGLIMVVWDKVMSRRLPFYFPLIHAGSALTGLVLLVIYILKHT